VWLITGLVPADPVLRQAARLLIVGVAAPWLAARAAAAAEAIATQHHSGRDVAVMLAREHASVLRASGRLDDIIAEAERRHRDWGRGRCC
jgi:ATP-binding cassette, subfamily C, bacterial CydC